MPQPFDMRLIQRGARLRRSPFFDGARRAGCSRYSFANHMYQPAVYGDQDPLEAYWQLVNGVTLWDVGTERQVEITGSDARRDSR